LGEYFCPVCRPEPRKEREQDKGDNIKIAAKGETDGG